MNTSAQLDFANVLGIPVFSNSKKALLADIKRILNEPFTQSRYICATSAHGIIEAQDDSAFNETLQNAYINYPDGKPLAWLGRLQGKSTMHQIKGPELTLQVCAMTATMPVKHYFYGGKPGVPEQLAQTLQNNYPGLQVAGCYSPPFKSLSDLEKRQIIQQINNSGADIIWVGLSTPKQEAWAASVASNLQAKLIFTVGAAFDFHTGHIPFAPAWMEKIGLEWLFRLISEPKRLWRRYFKVVPRFIGLGISQLLGITIKPRE
jgi:N-acetylglucosaminyldiphosphoundecaprenol N-acetyl-beta-D-mannosaminyltransferase